MTRPSPALLPAACLAMLLAACAAVAPTGDVTLTYETNPEGATLFEGGRSLGPAPVTRTYPNAAKAETVRTPEVTAVWPSGARETWYTVLPAGADRVATIERPKSAPNLQADLDHAKTVAASKEALERRQREEVRRDQARNSQRCKDQMSKGQAAVSDCS